MYQFLCRKGDNALTFTHAVILTAPEVGGANPDTL